MKRHGLLALCVAGLALGAASCGSGSTTNGPDRAQVLGARPELDAAARRADLRRALALIGGPTAKTLGYRLALAPRRDPELRALTDTGTRTITLYLARNDAPHRTAHDLAHELGHAWDTEHMTPVSRRAYLARRDAEGKAWWPSQRASDYSVGAGDFAEVFALCHAASPEFRSRLAPRPANPCAVLPKGAR